jgi:excisionase family DNA binding protein
VQAQKRKPYLTPNEAASMLMVSPITVRQWASKGLLKAELTLGGHRRFLWHEIERFARENGLSLQRADSAGISRVLVIDADPGVSRALGSFLADQPALRLETAVDGFDAGIRIPQFNPDLVMVDLGLEHIDGFEICRRLKSDVVTRGIRLVGLTSAPTPELTARALACGAERCLVKPLDVKSLREVFPVAAAS